MGGYVAAGGSAAGQHIRHVFVIAFENHDETDIIGNSAAAPYINDTLAKNYASASNFVDTLALNVPSEPHYVLMEAGDETRSRTSPSRTTTIRLRRTARVSWSIWSRR